MLLPLLLCSLTASAQDSEALVPEAPASKAPAPEAPATEAPATDAPATDAPATEAPATEPPASQAPALSDADNALLDALLELLSDDEAVKGADALGLLADPRALWVLRHSVTMREPPVAAAAARALGAFPDAGADLIRWVGDDALADEVRLATAHALAAQGPAGAADAIVAAMGMRSTTMELHDGLRAVLAERWPERLAEADRQVRRDGTAMLMLGSAGGMGYALAATGHFGQSGLEGLGGATGALGGATLGFVFGKTRPVEAGKASFFTTTGVGGLVAGTTLGVWAAPASDDAPWVGGILGGAAGYGLGLGLWSRYPGTSGQALLGGGVGITSGIFAASVAGVALENGANISDETVAGAFGLGLSAGLAAGHLTAPRWEIEGRDSSLIVASGLTGAFLGTAMPIGTMGRGPLPVATTSGGLLLAYALAPRARIDHDVVWGGMTGLTYGAVIGGGVGLLIDPPGGTTEATTPAAPATRSRTGDAAAQEATQRTAATLGGAAGLVAGGALAHRAPGSLRFDDGMLVGLTTGWATWQTLGWASVTEPNPAYTGALVIAPAAIGAGTAIATPLIDVEFGDSLAATSLGLWGAYLGAAGGELANANSDQTLMLALGLSDVGLLSGAALMSPLVDASPTVVGVADAGGVLGGSTAALVTALFTDNSDGIIVASMVGAGAGATGGALLGRSLDRRTPTVSLNLPGLPTLPAGLQLSPAYYAADDCDCWGARADLSGW